MPYRRWAVLLSASVERFGVSRMRDFLLTISKAVSVNHNETLQVCVVVFVVRMKLQMKDGIVQ